jgi:hypothetical protein
VIYIYIYAYLLSLSFLSFYSARYKKTGYLSATIILILVAALRFNTGTDFNTYATIWSGIPQLGSLYDVSNFYLEPAFVFSSSVLKTIYTGNFIFFFSFAAATVGMLSYSLYRLKLNVVAGLLLYFCLFYFAYTFNGMKQALSMSIFLISLVNLRDRDQKKYYLINLIGLLFHYSSIVYLIFGFILFLEISKKKLLILGVMLILAGTAAYLTNVIEVLVKYIFSNLFQSKVDTYFIHFQEGTKLIEFLPRLLLLVWILFCVFKLSPSQMQKSIVLFYFVGFTFYISLLDYNMLATRINMLFRICEIVLALSFLNSVLRSENKVLIYSGFLLVYTVQFYINISSQANNYILRTSF